MMPRCYQLVGVPGSGKSTWASQQSWAADGVVVGTDQFVQAYADRVGKSYTEVFDEYMPTAVLLMTDMVVAARERSADIIWDQTSTTVASRKKKFAVLPGYYHIAVVFRTPTMAELKRRLACRPGKVVPWDVVMGMINLFEVPTEAEGFKEIWYV